MGFLFSVPLENESINDDVIQKKLLFIKLQMNYKS